MELSKCYIFQNCMNNLRKNKDYSKSKKHLFKFFVNKSIHKAKNISKIFGSRKALTSNDIEYIIKVVKSLENRGILTGIEY